MGGSVAMHEGELPPPDVEVAPVSKGRLPFGMTAGEYVVSGFIAGGGCGYVYHARHRRHEGRAAVKVLHASLASLPKMVQRFAREVEVIKLLCHPNIVQIYEIGVLRDGRPFYVMEYLEGRTLAKVLEEEGRFSPAEALSVLDPVCDALSAAHAAGIIHRDVKASNICVGRDQRSVKLLDFGIAKLLGPRSGRGCLTSEGRQIGTLTIMAPEQLLGRPVDARIDVYALGILLFRLLTGKLPFDGKGQSTLAQQHLEEPVPRPSHRVPLSPALDAIVLRAMEKDPGRRFPSVAEFLSELRAAVGPTRVSRDPTPEATAMGVAIYLEIHMGMDVDEVDRRLSNDIAYLLDVGEESLDRGGFLLASVTGSEILGVRTFPESDPEGLQRVRGEAMDLAILLHARVSGRPGADPRVQATVSVHIAPVQIRLSARPEVLGGPLVQTAAWAPRGEVRGLYVTPEAQIGRPGGRSSAITIPAEESA